MPALPKIELISAEQALTFTNSTFSGSLLFVPYALYLSFDPNTKLFTAIAIEKGEIFIEEFSTIQMAYAFLLGQYSDPKVLRTIEKVAAIKYQELVNLNG